MPMTRPAIPTPSQSISESAVIVLTGAGIACAEEYRLAMRRVVAVLTRANPNSTSFIRKAALA
jgi:hypothetical protein